MEKYARQALSEGIKNAEDLRVSVDSELYRVLNLHYNRNNHIEVSFFISEFCINYTGKNPSLDLSLVTVLFTSKFPLTSFFSLITKKSE